MNGYVLAYILAGSVIAPFLAEVVMNRHGTADDITRVINNVIAFWLWPLLAVMVVAVSIDRMARKWGQS